jgi:Protein of unknown function (DUF3489)
MDALLKLSPAQSLLLRTAARRADGCVIPPDTLRGGARIKVLTALLQSGWIEPCDDGHALTDAGYEVVGRQRPAPPQDLQTLDTPDDPQLLESIQVRPGTKLAALVVALRRPEGATALQMMLATGWKPHTVRGAISGILRKKLGLNVVSSKAPEDERVYRIAPRTYPSSDQSEGGMSPD